jgi:hypothetical protein
MHNPYLSPNKITFTPKIDMNAIYISNHIDKQVLSNIKNKT